MSSAAEVAGRDAPEQVIGRSYTKARRHPLVIGKSPGGGRLWGGPYTIPQIAVMVGSFVVLVLFREVWAHQGVLVNGLLALAVPYSLGLVVRRVHVDGRNPLAVAVSALGLVSSPAQGRLGGRPLKSLAKRSPLRGACTLTWHEQTTGAQRRARPAASVTQPVRLPAAEAGARRPSGPRTGGPAPAPLQTGGSPQPRVMSGVGALLAAREARMQTERDG